MRQFVRQIVPQWLRRVRVIRSAKAKLGRIEELAFHDGALASVGRLDLNALFRSGDYEAQWRQARKEIASLKITAEAHGVNPGDRKALYYLVHHLRPRSILEVGTHIGASTVHLAAALRSLKSSSPAVSFRLTTVDVRDVNDPITGPWRQFGCSMSPEETIHQLGCREMVTFATAQSVDFLAACRETYDFIFLDGDHSAPTVYRELSAASGLVNPGGLIVLHDFFPQHRPLWHNGVMQPGPSLATARLQAEGRAIGVVPLGKLPWQTKRDSTVTSLAIVGRSGREAA
jgi:predicted O-methyltransferase YrrM